MQQSVVPMVHVPDVKAAAEWYVSIGFELRRSNEEDGEMNWALLTYGNAEVMLDAGGKASGAERREVDLYVHSEDLDGLFARLKDQVEVVEGPHETFYGMREFIVRDLNRFWITFGQPVA